MEQTNQTNLTVVTGASSGFGRLAAHFLAERRHDLHLVCRDAARAATVAEEIERISGAPPAMTLADLSVGTDVDRAAEEIGRRARPIRLLLNNAGAVFGLRRQVGSDGIEQTFALNHLAYFRLTLRLLDRIEAAAPATVVNVASDAYRFAGGRFDFDNYNGDRCYRPHRQYGASKLANILFTEALARRLEGSSVRTVAWSPTGLTATRFGYGAHRLAPLAMKLTHPFALKPGVAARPLLALCGREISSLENGRFVLGDTPSEVPPCNRDDADRLWALSAELTGVGR